MVGVTGFEPAASKSQTSRATNCATPRNGMIQQRYIIMLLNKFIPIIRDKVSFVNVQDSGFLSIALDEKIQNIVRYGGDSRHAKFYFVSVHKKESHCTVNFYAARVIFW